MEDKFQKELAKLADKYTHIIGYKTVISMIREEADDIEQMIDEEE